MDILLTQTTAVGAAAAAADLRRHGHHVEVCHPDGAEVCVALSGGRCPLDLGTIDAAVVVRSHATPNELPLERGAVCAAIRGVPLIVAGDPADNPCAPWATADEESARPAATGGPLGHRRYPGCGWRHRSQPLRRSHLGRGQ